MIFHKRKYVEVLLPLAIPKSYTYYVPENIESEIQFGIRVEVSLRKKYYSGLIISVSDIAPSENIDLKPITGIIDKMPIIDKKHFDLWKWISEYYMCTLGEIMNAALPSGLKMSSETIVYVNNDTEFSKNELNDDEFLIFEALEIQNELNIKQIQQIVGKTNIYGILQKLIEKRIVDIREEMVQSYKPKKIKLIELTENYSTEDKINELFEKIKKSKHKTNALLAYFQLNSSKGTVEKSELINSSKVTSSVIKDMVDKGFLLEREKIISRLKPWIGKIGSLPLLSEKQQETISKIDDIFKNQNHVLLHGVTGSGKTRIYQEYINRIIGEGGQVLFLVPEIGLTTHLINRLTEIFGNQVYVFHSKLNQQERVEIWNEVFNGKPIILAARSGIFLPFKNLKMIIVDEEHDSSFKQQSPSPHYNARDIASYLGSVWNLKIILGSATPSLESYYNTQSEKYGYVKLEQRFGDVSLPEIRIVDLTNKSVLFTGNSKYSINLISTVQSALNKNEQVLLFQNRRGYAPTVICNTCGWNAKCPNCDISLTYHKEKNELRCHYCGHRTNMAELCPVCNSHHLNYLGYGTEKIENELKTYFPEARIKRMDLDTMRTKSDMENLINEFVDRNIDILIGTQMVTKGLDFENISLVGIINFDSLTQFPDFRANERAFQLAVQVGGRAGRRKKQGLVLIQTYYSENPLLHHILNNDFNNFIKNELAEREKYQYPPFNRLIEVTLYHKKYDTCRNASFSFAAGLKAVQGLKILGPSVPGISRLRGLYQFNIIIKLDKSSNSMKKLSKLLFHQKIKLYSETGYRSVKIKIDVDPY
jgi:primosomal protein N' (replication factor Y) (superfamily II helicase)